MDKARAKTLASAIKDEAKRLGFCLVGITTPDPPDHIDVLENWLAKGHHAGMAYMSADRARQRRSDPRLILPECQAIIVLAANYLPNTTTPEQRNQPFQIATYALGDDYHYVLPERMERLVGFIQDQTGREIRYRIYTDTGPILERELAQRAGLGWIGKNTCLIHPQLGSHFLLAEILVDIPLPVDDAFPHDRCGTCTRCIEACPTRCILPDRTIDSRKCISYWTIEAKDAIPIDIRPEISNWLFGCDICQQVCPYNNAFARPTNDSAFQIRPSLENLELEHFLRLPPQDWKKLFQGSPLIRPRRRGLMRNAAVVAGNTQATNLVPQLTHLLQQDPEALVRSHAAWALGRIGSPKALAALRDSRSQERVEAVVEEIIAALETQ